MLYKLRIDVKEIIFITVNFNFNIEHDKLLEGQIVGLGLSLIQKRHLIHLKVPTYDDKTPCSPSV